MIIYGHHLSNRFKVQVGFFVAAILIISLPFASHLNTEPGPAFWSCFFILLSFGMVNGMIQGQVFGLASILPEKYMGAVMLGNGYSGITMNLLKAILMFILPGKDNMYRSALIFFVLASMILLLCSASFTILNTTEYFIYY
jgi:phosphatidylglycerophosphate synthase